MMSLQQLHAFVEGTIEQISTMFPVLLVTGPRQVGRTTLLQKLAETQRELGVDRKYVTLDDPDVRYLAKNDPALFMQRYTPPVLIDEIQYATELLPYIVSSPIIALVQPYHNNALKRVVKMPLLHFLDTGLAAYLLKWGNPEALERGAMSGAFFESYVFSEIYKSYLNAGKEPPIYYYRDKDQKEIDLLIFQNGILSPIEIKKAASPGKTAIKNFHVLDPVSASGTFDGLETLKVEIGTGSVVCMANELLPVDEKNWYVPVWLI